MALSYADNPQVQKNRWRILTAVGLFTFMATLDGSIVNIALPVMSRDLKIPMNQSEWIVSIYLIMICALLLLFGKVGDASGKLKFSRLGLFFSYWAHYYVGLTVAYHCYLVRGSFKR